MTYSSFNKPASYVFCFFAILYFLPRKIITTSGSHLNHLPRYIHHAAQRIHLQRPCTANGKLLKLGDGTRRIGFSSIRGGEGDAQLFRFFAKPLVKGIIRRIIHGIQIITFQRIRLDRRPFITGIGTILLSFHMAVFHNFRKTVSFIYGFLLTNIAALIITGDIIRIRRRVAAFVGIADRTHLLQRNKRLPVNGRYRSLHG